MEMEVSPRNMAQNLPQKSFTTELLGGCVFALLPVPGRLLMNFAIGLMRF